MHFGQSLHRAFESIDWYQPDLKFEKLLDQKCDASLVQTMKNCFNSESFQQLFKQPDQQLHCGKKRPSPFVENNPLFMEFLTECTSLNLLRALILKLKS